jgi:hypothetical protein
MFRAAQRINVQRTARRLLGPPWREGRNRPPLSSDEVKPLRGGIETTLDFVPHPPAPPGLASRAIAGALGPLWTVLRIFLTFSALECGREQRDCTNPIHSFMYSSSNSRSRSSILVNCSGSPAAAISSVPKR